MINKGKRYQGLAILVIILFAAGLIYCGVLVSRSYSNGLSSGNTGETVSPDATRSFVGVVKALDLENQTISILGVDNPVVTNFSYNGGTDVRSQYDKVISMKKITLGEIVNFTYNAKTNKLLSLQIYKEAWTYENVKKMKMDRGSKIIQLGTSRYGFTDSILYVGDNKIIDVTELSAKDQLMVKGVGDMVYSIIVTKGHGTIRFTGFEDFVGGTVYIGASTYQRVEDTMNIVMRQGTYKVTMQNGELVGTKEVTVERDSEVTVDMSEFKIEKAKIGEVTFTISPYGADLYVNGSATDYSNPVTLNYGEHTIAVSLPGYKSFSGILTVGQSEQEIQVNLVPDTSKDESSGSDNIDKDTSDDDLGDIVLDWDSDSTDDLKSSASPSPAPSSTSSATAATPSPSPSASSSSNNGIDGAHKITISAPEDVEVYIDDAYKGMTPISFTKVLGSHVVTLKKSGYTTKSYTIHVENDNENVFYTFADLVKE